MNSNNHLLSDLNPSQREAVTHVDGPLLMLAGPGSGKTRVITHRIAHLVEQGIPANSIVALTFTNKAAEEMKNRISRLIAGNRVWTGTFHRFCSRIIRNYSSLVGLSENFSIYDMSDSKKVIKQAIQNAEVNLQHHSPDSIAEKISKLKSQAVSDEFYEASSGDYVGAIVQRVYPEYQKLLKMANAVDFDDLLLYCVEMLRQNPELRKTLDVKFQYMMVDEYQDTNLAQYQLIRLLNHSVQTWALLATPINPFTDGEAQTSITFLNLKMTFPS